MAPEPITFDQIGALSASQLCTLVEECIHRIADDTDGRIYLRHVEEVLDQAIYESNYPEVWVCYYDPQE